MRKLIVLIAVILAGFLTSCSVQNAPGVNKPFKSYSISPISNVLYMEFDIIYGQTHLVGKLVVSNDSRNLYVIYNITDPAVNLNEVHLWVGSDLSTAPVNDQGVPVPGQFPHEASGLSANTYIFTIPFSELGIPDVTAYCGLPLYILAHAQLDNNETVWSFGTSFSSWTGTSRWGWYSTYYINCDNGTPDPVYKFETAFAEGNYVFTTDSRSNPEHLPSLNLTRNRWGWAISLTGNGLTTYHIYAGAGLNRTENGTLVGTLTVNAEAGNVTVTYTMLPGFKLSEVHVYAGDTKPATLAPGRYGNTAYFSPLANTYTLSIPVSDSNGDGIWLIAHAVVGIPQ